MLAGLAVLDSPAPSRPIKRGRLTLSDSAACRMVSPSGGDRQALISAARYARTCKEFDRLARQTERRGSALDELESDMPAVMRCAEAGVPQGGLRGTADDVLSLDG